MDWFEKEASYEEQFRKGKQAKSLWKYIPARKQALVDDAFSDSDGYWIFLDENHVAYDGGEDCRIIHEYTIADLKEAVKTIRRISK